MVQVAAEVDKGGGRSDKAYAWSPLSAGRVREQMDMSDTMFHTEWKPTVEAVASAMLPEL